MKKFLKLVLWVFIIFIVLSIGLVIFVQTNNKTVVNELKKQLNKFLLTEVQINDMHISSFRNFPNITLILDKVVIKEFPKESGHNLAEFDKLYLVMNLFDFIKKKYIVQKVIFNTGKINIRRYKNNSYNYEILKTDTSDTSTSNVDFKINKAALQEVWLSYIDEPSDYNFTVNVKKCDLKGNFIESPYKMRVHSKTQDFKLRLHKRNFNKNELIEIQTVLDYNVENEIFELHESKLWIDKNKIEINGSYIYDIKKEASQINLELEANSINYKTLLDYLPDNYKYDLKDYLFEGDISIKSSIKGVYDSKHFPSIQIDFKTNNTSVSYKTEEFSIQKIKLKGSFNNGEKANSIDSKISVSDFEGIIDNNKIAGSIVIQNIKDPYIDLQLKSIISLKSFNPFIAKSNLKFDTGSVNLNLIYKGKMKGIKTMTDQEKLEAKLLFVNAGLSDKSVNRINNLNGDIQLTENKFIVKALSAKINQNNYSFNGFIVGLIPYLLKNSLNLEIVGDLAIDKLDLSKKKKISTTYNQSFIMPELNGLDFDLNLKLDELIVPGFSANQLIGKVQVKNENIIAKKLNFKTSYGSAVVTGMLSKSPRNEITFEGQTTLSKVDLNKLFIQFKNFGQSNITDKNLKGTADANIQIIISFDSNLNFIESNLYALSDITITNGELINYQTIQNLFGFIKLKKMNNIQFDKIQNTIIIKDREINIPKMTMRSSACNLEVQGKHTFDDQMEYNFKINLTKLFFGKNKIDQKQFENSEDDLKGGINLYVTMYGDGADPKFKLNKSSSVSKKVKDGLQVQKKEMKDILKKRHDQNKDQNKDPKNDKQIKNNDFELEWDDK